MNQLIVCERTGRWATALGRELSRPIRQTRSLSQCWKEFPTVGVGFAVVELTERNVEDLLRRMARLERDFPFVRLAVVAARRLAAYQWLMREAGAVHFVCSPRQLGPLALSALRHLEDLLQSPQTSPPQDPTERIWASLPWQDAA
jgi:hypothetical protein